MSATTFARLFGKIAETVCTIPDPDTGKPVTYRMKLSALSGDNAAALAEALRHGDSECRATMPRDAVPDEIPTLDRKGKEKPRVYVTPDARGFLAEYLDGKGEPAAPAVWVYRAAVYSGPAGSFVAPFQTRENDDAAAVEKAARYLATASPFACKLDRVIGGTYTTRDDYMRAEAQLTADNVAPPAAPPADDKPRRPRGRKSDDMPPAIGDRMEAPAPSSNGATV